MRNLLRTATWMTGIAMMIELFARSQWAFAAPVEVVLFKKSAQVTEISRMTIHNEGKGQGRVRLVLPSKAQPESLKILLPEDPDVKISGISWCTLARKGNKSWDAKQKQLNDLKAQQKRLHADIKGLEAQISFWQSQTKAKTKTLNDATNLSAAISRNIKKAWQEKITLEGQSEKLEQSIGILQNEIKEAAGTTDQDWDVSLQLTGWKPAQQAISLKYSYEMFDCGWKSIYRVEALSRQGRIEYSQDAEIWQNSMRDWDGVQLSIAIKNEADMLSKEKSPGWKVSVQKTGNRKNSGKKEIEDVSAKPLPIRNPAVPFSRSLGGRDIPSGKKMIIPVENAGWPAVFTHVLKPFSNSSSRIMAVLSSPSPVQIPESSATFFMDGMFIGVQEFEFIGQEKTLLFGSDSTVSAEVKMLSKPDGAAGNDGGAQTWKWHWRTVVKNESGNTVNVLIEEPVPQINDRRIKYEVKGEPAFSDERPSGSRKLVMPSGSNRAFETFVSIEAPKELNLEMTWNP
jgi:hypothetical protein